MAFQNRVRVIRDSAPHDEVGSPDAAICECSDCGILFRRESWHRCGGVRLEWDEYVAQHPEVA